MTSAYRCNGCGEYWEVGPLVTVGMDTDSVRHTDFMIDDMPAAIWSQTNSAQAGDGDYCPECGRELLEMLVERFDSQ